MRAEWDIARYLRSGRLVQLLPDHATPPADICAVYPQRHQTAARVRVFVEFLAQAFQQQITLTEHDAKTALLV
jgi:DNA-binding transcriptional LysR family regulator